MTSPEFLKMLTFQGVVFIASKRQVSSQNKRSRFPNVQGIFKNSVKSKVLADDRDM